MFRQPGMAIGECLRYGECGDRKAWPALLLLVLPRTRGALCALTVSAGGARWFRSGSYCGSPDRKGTVTGKEGASLLVCPSLRGANYRGVVAVWVPGPIGKGSDQEDEWA
jgi:hypothetical protein